MKKIQPYASWSSPLTPKNLAEKGRRYGHMDVDNGFLYWLEIRAAEQGRGVLMRANRNQPASEVLPGSLSVRTKVHEYGGGDFIVADGVVFFSNAEDNQVYQFDGKLTQLTQTDPQVEQRYADFCLAPNKKYLLAVRECHRQDQVINDLICISIETQSVTVVHQGFDFYSFPRISPAGHRVCWTCWNQPDMPWDAAELWLADFHQSGHVDAAHKVRGGDRGSVFQPEWSEEGVLHYICDASGWGNLYSHSDGVLNALAPIDRDFGVPQWIFGLGTYVINKPDSLYAVNFENGEQHLCHIDLASGHIEPISLPFTHYEGALLGDSEHLYFCAASPTIEAAMYQLDLQSRQFTALTPASDFVLNEENISLAKSIRFESSGQRECHAFYYAPVNSQFEAPEDSLPPLIVMSHGGPTAYANNSLDPAIQFWTNRGFAVVDVNYGGSTGYGRAYRELLSGQWGVVDVEDCIAAAQYLVKEGLANEKALLIRGGSAGGYTTLCGLTFYDVFAAGMSRYGVADLESLASDSHKFEARYLDKMVGSYPKEKAIYQERSPIHFTDKLSCPVLLLQGADDKVVPPNQAEKMVTALKQKSIPYAYLLFEGEGHGFRKAETIITAFSAELDFYRQILGVKSQEKIEPVSIENFESITKN